MVRLLAALALLFISSASYAQDVCLGGPAALPQDVRLNFVTKSKKLESCFVLAGDKAPPAKFKLLYRLVDGKFQSARFSKQAPLTPDVTACVQAMLKTWTWPKTKGKFDAAVMLSATWTPTKALLPKPPKEAPVVAVISAKPAVPAGVSTTAIGTAGEGEMEPGTGPAAKSATGTATGTKTATGAKTSTGTKTATSTATGTKSAFGVATTTNTKTAAAAKNAPAVKNWQATLTLLRQAPSPTLPDAFTKALAKQYKDYMLPVDLKPNKDPKAKPAVPSPFNWYLYADVAGDKEPDFAVFLKHKTKPDVWQIVMLVPAKDDGFQHHVLLTDATLKTLAPQAKLPFEGLFLGYPPCDEFPNPSLYALLQDGTTVTFRWARKWFETTAGSIYEN